MAYLSLSLLGPFQSWTANGSLKTLRTHKERALLAYLVVENNRSHLREKLSELFWPGRPESVARNNLRQALYGIRQAIGEPGFDVIFSVTADEVQVADVDQLWLDLDAFKLHLKTAQMHAHDPEYPCSYCIQHLRDAVELYRGIFLEDVRLEKMEEFNRWADYQRERFSTLHLQALDLLIRDYERLEDFAQAAFYARRQVESNGFREDAHQRLMILLAKNGRDGEALEQFETYRRQLLDSTGLAPNEKMTAVVEEIRRGEFDTAASSARAVAAYHVPEQLTPFIGREMELSQVGRLLDSPACRLITLAGLAGVGKTRLAVQAAQLSRRLFPDGIFFISLEAVQPRANLVDVIGRAFGLVPSGQNDMRALLFDYLRRKNVLIILDNFEHLMESKGILLDILKELPLVKILVTSRERLALQTECLVELQGMSFPAPDALENQSGQDRTVLEHSDALKLLFERASRLRPDLPWRPGDNPDLLPGFNAQEMAAAVRICQLVGGLPLGIELAASWARDFTFAQIADEVNRSLEFLQTSFQDLPERHRSMRASFEHSWELLSESEREVFCKLAVFPGSFTALEAQEVAAAALPWLVRLEDKSLVRRVAFGRFDMHPLIRQFAGQKLRQYSRKVEDATRQMHAEYFCSLLGAREMDLKGQRQVEALAELDAERDNLYAAWDWAVERRFVDLLEKAAFALMLFLEMSSRWQDGEVRFHKALQCLEGMASSPAVTRLRAVLLSFQGWFSSRQARFQQAAELLGESLQLMGDTDETLGRTFAHFAFGFTNIWLNRFDEALLHLKTSHLISERTGDHWTLAWSRQALAEIAFESGKTGFQDAPFLESLSMFEKIGEKRGSSRALNFLGNIALSQGQYAAARSYFEKLLSNTERMGDVWGAAGGYSKLGQLAATLGEYEQAWRLLQRSLSMLQKTGDNRRIAYTMRELGDLSAGLNKLKEAESFYRQALEIAMQIQTTPLAQDVLISIAGLLNGRGQPERAMELLKLVIQETISDQRTARRAQNMMDTLRDSLPSTQFEQLRRLAGHTRLWDATANLLRSESML